MAGTKGASRGSSAMTVQSPFTGPNPARPASPTALARSRPGCRRRPRRDRCRGSGCRCRRARRRRAPRRPGRARPRRRRCARPRPRPPAISTPPSTSRRSRVVGERVDVEALADPHLSRPPGSSARARSAGVVIFRLSGSPGTTATRRPSASTSAASSVASGSPVRGPGAERVEHGTPAGSAPPPARSGRGSRRTVASAPARRAPASRCRSPPRAGTAPAAPGARRATDDRREELAARRAGGPRRGPPRSRRSRPDRRRGRPGPRRPGWRRPRRRRRPRGPPSGRAGRHDQHHARRRPTRQAATDRSATVRPARDDELLGLAEAGAGPAGHDDPPDPAHWRWPYGSASLSRCSAVSSSTARAKVSSETRIWRARLSIRFSPADRPLSLSRMERFRTTSATW